MILTYPMQVGQNFDEILRAVDALKRNEKYNVVTPAGWLPSNKLIAPPLFSDDEVIEKFGVIDKKTDYVRLIKDPIDM